MKDSDHWLDNEIDRKIDVTAILFLLVENRQQTHNWTLIGSGANGLGIQECPMKIYRRGVDFYNYKLVDKKERNELTQWLH